MILASQRRVLRVSLFAVLALALAAEPARAQHRCTRQQSGGGSQSQLSTMPLGYLSQVPPYALQQYALQQSALQQYALQQYALQAQLNALPNNVFLAQLNTARQNGVQPNAGATVESLQSQLDDLRNYISDQEESGRLSASQLRALRQKEKTLTKRLQAAQKRAASNQTRQAQLSGPAAQDR
jgi:hypothetical protein